MGWLWWAGRINRATYWIWIGLGAALCVAIYLTGKKVPAVGEVVFVMLSVPRLHDVGKSGWWAGGFILAEILIIVISLATLPLSAVPIISGLFVIVVLGFLVWLGTIPGQPEANKYGEPPAPGFPFVRRSKTPPT